MASKVICEFATGLPPEEFLFLCDIYSSGDAIEFYTDISCEVDWGDNQYYKYDAGVVQGFPKKSTSTAIKVRSVEKIKKLYFGDGASYNQSITAIEIHRASTLEDAERMCYNLEKMERFVFTGTNKVSTFESAWENCTHLKRFTGMSTVSAVTFKKAWKNCSQLTEFPSLYSKFCLTVEEAWMGCTNMVWFPLINVSYCENFDNAWAGNVRLSEFPLIDTGAGKTFHGTWSYCINMLYFPTLDFKNAEDMAYSFAYNYKVKRYPAFNTGNCYDFKSMFEKNTSLKCITAINTLNQFETTDMFKRTDSLMAPTPTEQFMIKSGYDYLNPNPCAYNAGRSRFFAMGVTNTNLTTFTVYGSNFEVDWGNGIFLNYNEGSVTGMPIDTNVVSIRAEGKISHIRIDSDTFVTFSIKRGKDITSLASLFENKIELKEFNIEAILPVCKTMYAMLKNAISLKTIPGEIIYDYVETVESMLEGCASFTGFDDMFSNISFSRCTNFKNMLKGCSNVEYLPNIITSLGENFDEMMRDMIGLRCLIAIDTSNATSSSNMFMNDAILARPTKNEQTAIMSIPGKAYNNGGNCSAKFIISFRSSGSVSFTVDNPIQIDIGNGNFVAKPAGQITVTPIGEAFIFGDVSDISFDTDTFTDVVFYEYSGLSTMKDMFINKANIKSVKLIGSNNVVDLSGMFKDSGINEFFATADALSGIVNLESMFMNTASLSNVHNLDTPNGENFEHMFENTSIVCIGGINTSSAVFPKFGIKCADKVKCIDEIKCWGDSTMFNNTTSIVSPNALERDEIMRRSIFISSKC